MRSLLIVDDNVRVVRSLARLLGVCGFQVSTALSVEEAESFLRERRVDVVLTDMQMPGRTGLDLLARLPELAPGALSVLMTGVTAPPDVRRALAMGATAVLEKPFEVARLLEVLGHI